MKATLDPDDPKRGTTTLAAPGVHTGLMTCLKCKYSIKRWGIIRGHLLNDHLGGEAKEENLFPISQAANKCHLNQIERYVKYLVYNGRSVQYNVTVYNEDGTQSFNENNPRTRFRCQAATTDSGPAVNVSYDVKSDISTNRTNREDDISAFQERGDSYSDNLPSSPWNPRR